MSKVLEQETEFNDLECVRESIAEHGLTPVFNENGNLVTMEGYDEQFLADIGIAKTNFMEVTKLHSYGDLGFKQNEDGSVKFIGDDALMSNSQFGEFYDKFSVTYAEKKYVKEMYQQGFTLASKVQTVGGGVDLQFNEVGLGF
jgi:hypothetical protein